MNKIKKHPKKYPLIVIGAIAIVLVAAMIAFLKFGNWATTQNGDSVTNPSSSTSSDVPQTNGDEKYTDTSNPQPSENTQETGDSSALSVLLTSKNIIDSKLVIRAQINSLLTSGSCQLTLEKSGSDTVSKEAGIFNNASVSTCEGFDIPVNELSPGTWTITIKVSSENKSGIVTDEITL